MMGDPATGSDRVGAKAGKGAKAARAERVAGAAAKAAKEAKAAKVGREAATETQLMLVGEAPVDLGHSVHTVAVGLTTRNS